MASFAAELRTLFHLVLKPHCGSTHAERLENFYQGQAEGYDDFRSRLLHGRRELFATLREHTPEGGCWLDFGAGTGSNLALFGERLLGFDNVVLIDLSPSLLAKAQQRIKAQGLTHVCTQEADVCRPLEGYGQASLITFSYSLTMIPDWFTALEQAERLLAPGGVAAVVDFYVSRKYVATQQRQHGWLTRTLWPLWFAHDDVFLSQDHVPYLHQRFECIDFHESAGSVPYLPFMKVPYYRFVGRKL